MNIKTPFRKLKRFTFPFALLVFLFSSSYLLNVSFVVSQQLAIETELAVTFLCMGMVVLFFFVVASLSNPGYLKPQKSFN